LVKSAVNTGTTKVPVPAKSATSELVEELTINAPPCMSPTLEKIGDEFPGICNIP
jgi:hypothetical protein